MNRSHQNTDSLQYGSSWKYLCHNYAKRHSRMLQILHHLKHAFSVPRPFVIIEYSYVYQTFSPTSQLCYNVHVLEIVPYWTAPVPVYLRLHHCVLEL